MIDQEILNGLVQVRDMLKKTTTAYYNASKRHSISKHDHDKTFCIAQADGTLVGKNEDARYGSFVIAYPNTVADLERAEIELNDARKELELARIEEAYFARLLQLATMANGETDG